MSKLPQRRYETKLERAKPEEIPAILDAKLDATSPEQVVDYVGFATESIEQAISRVKENIEAYKAIKEELIRQLDIVKEGTSCWLSDAGVDKLNGDILSSISVFEKASKKELIITDEEALINAGYFKTVLDKAAVKSSIEGGEDIDGARLEVTHQQPSIRINRKR